MTWCGPKLQEYKTPIVRPEGVNGIIEIKKLGTFNTKANTLEAGPWVS